MNLLLKIKKSFPAKLLITSIVGIFYVSSGLKTKVKTIAVQTNRESRVNPQ